MKREYLHSGRIAVLLVLLAGATPGYSRNLPADISPASDAPRTAPVELNRDYIRGYFTDTRDIMLSPIHWTGTQWKAAALTLGVAAALFSVDGEVRDEVQENRSSGGDDLSRAARSFGEVEYALPALGAFYLYGRFGEDAKAAETALLSLESIAVSGFISGAVKVLAHRDRPNTGHSSDIWHGPGLSTSDSDLSFPSRHSATVFSAAAVIATEYSGNRYIPPAAYGIATLSALSRVNDDEHWLSDVFFGSAVGYFTARAICRGRGGGNTAVLPLLDGSAGLRIARRL